VVVGYVDDRGFSLVLWQCGGGWGGKCCGVGGAVAVDEGMCEDGRTGGGSGWLVCEVSILDCRVRWFRGGFGARNSLVCWVWVLACVGEGVCVVGVGHVCMCGRYVDGVGWDAGSAISGAFPSYPRQRRRDACTRIGYFYESNGRGVGSRMTQGCRAVTRSSVGNLRLGLSKEFGAGVGPIQKNFGI
jgi:hypothetical protein